MLTGILLISLISFIAVVSYRRPRLEQRVIKRIPLIDWLNIFVFPLVFYAGIVMIVRSIFTRPRISILDFDDSLIIGVGVIFAIYFFVGLSVHFVSKVLSRYIRSDSRSRIFTINEIFHGKLSHYVTFVSSWMVGFTMAILEINYPLADKISSGLVILIGLIAMLGGFSATKTVFYTSSWYGGYNKPLFLITALLLYVLIVIYRANKLSLYYYPLNIFVAVLYASIIWTFLIRQFLIFSKLSKKRRLQFLTKVLSA